MENQTKVIFTQIMERPKRKLILRRSKKATHYFEYIDEFEYCAETETGIVGGPPHPWETLCQIKEALYEPVGLWLTHSMTPPDTGIYAHGVEVPFDFAGAVPEGFEIIDLEPCLMLVFQGEPYDDDNFMEEVGSCMERIDRYNPEVYGYQYDAENTPKMQLAPLGWRGYIEMRPVRKV